MIRLTGGVIRVLGFFSAMLVLVTACVPLPPPASPRIATVRVISPGVRVNGVLVPDHYRFRDGDRISTDTRGRARLEFSDGSWILIGEATDPFIRKIKEAVMCLFKVIVEVGQIEVNDGSVCRFETETPHLSGLTQSEINLRVTRTQSTVTLLHGGFKLLKPRPIRLRPRERLVIKGGRVVARSLIHERELRAIMMWRSGFFPKPGQSRSYIKVPFLVGTTLDKARRLLQKVGLVPGRIRYQSMAGKPPDTVIRQSIKAGQRVKRGVRVDLWVTPQRVLHQIDQRILQSISSPLKVPSLVNKTIEAAGHQLKSLGLGLKVMGGSGGGVIASQDPRPGATLKRGEVVKVWLRRPCHAC